MHNTKDRSLETVRLEVQSLFDNFGNWERVGKHYNVSRTVVWRIANDGYEPKKSHLRRLLGLPQIIIREQPRDKKGRFASL